MTVNKIEVSYGRTVSGPKDYESRKAEATIGVTLDVTTGETVVDLELDEAMSYAMNVVHMTLGIGGANKTTPKSQPVAPVDTGTEEAPVEELTRGQKAARTRAANKAKQEAEEDAKAELPVAPEITDDNSGTEEDVTTRSPEPEPEDDIMGLRDDDEFDMDAPIVAEEPEEVHDEISDVELGAEINKKVKLLKGEGDAEAVKRVQAAIASFNTNGVDPYTAGMMSQAQRRKFLAKLDALKARKAS